MAQALNSVANCLESVATSFRLGAVSRRVDLRGLPTIRDRTLRWRHPNGNEIEKATDMVLCTSPVATTRTREATTGSWSARAQAANHSPHGRSETRARGSVVREHGDPVHGGSRPRCERASRARCTQRAHAQRSRRHCRRSRPALAWAPTARRPAATNNLITSGSASQHSLLAGQPCSPRRARRGSPAQRNLREQHGGPACACPNCACASTRAPRRRGG